MWRSIIWPKFFCERTSTVGAELRGTVAFVTGASSGIGEATAVELSRRGAAVVVVARRLDRLQALAERITRAGGTALAIEADVAEREQVHEAIERTVRAWGRLDILINNAGLNRPDLIEEANAADFDHVVRVNLLGSLYCAKAALPHLLWAAEHSSRRVADLVNVSSLSGRIHRVGSAVYTATKHAVNAYSECLRQEIANRNVRVSVLEPASVDTEFFAAFGQHKPNFTAPQLKPGDIAETIGYMVTRPSHLAISDLLVRPTTQGASR